LLTPQPQQRIAIIDLGSNTARLIVMSAVSGYAYHLDDEIREVVRLRQGMTHRGLSEEAVGRALFTLRLFKRFCDSSQVDLIIPTATSAVREGANGALFVERVKQEIGLSLRVLSGEEEAYYGTLGALNEVVLSDGYVLDIGGGSAQVSEVRGRRFVRGVSHPLGALALTERFVRHDPVGAAEVQAICDEIDKHLNKIEWLAGSQKPKKHSDHLLIGLGGTSRNMAGMAAAREGFPLSTLHGYALGRDALDENIRLLRALPLQERQMLPGLSSDRADIILPGALVLGAVMERLQVEKVTVSVNGLREGLFFEHFWQHLSYPVIDDVRRFSVLNIARIYNYHKRHTNHVRFLAGCLFNQLGPLHGYGRAERELLDTAALLHDLGQLISYPDHHLHSQALIANSGLPGFSPRETALIGLLARYHRRGRPRINGYESLLQPDDEQLLMKLAALLRLAEFLERGRNATVDDVTASWDDETLRLTLIADEYPAVEIWGAERNAADLVEKAFGRRLVLETTATPGDWPVSSNR
jgi:exopolyphosphatase/guanosine-5'-triphosphate,3'-diphosphate pyrophosphatase